MARLILVRHGTSEYNRAGKWTGITDINLAQEGYDDARIMGELIKDVEIDSVHISKLKRTQQTLDEILKVLNKSTVPVTADAALNERDYGVHTGKNKWQVKEAVGEEAFREIRRGWDAVIENGENLKDVHNRVVPYFEKNILPELTQGKNVLVVSHGNTLRALVKYLENISDDEAPSLEFNFGEVHCYDFDHSGKMVDKEIRSSGITRVHV